MELTAKQIESGELVQKIIAKAWDDESFKKKLLVNPMAAITNASGKAIHIPEGKTLMVNDQTDESIIYINIPSKPDIDDLELSEKQLEAVAGGDFWGVVGAMVLGPVTILTDGPEAFVEDVITEMMD